MENFKTPAEEAYKDAYGEYPMGEPFWIVFQKGYKAAQKDYKVGEYEPKEKEQKWGDIYETIGTKHKRI